MCKMRNVDKASLYFNSAALEELKTNPNSCVTVRDCEHHLALHPFHLNNLQNSIKELLNKGLTRYNSTFDGILLGYQNVIILNSTAPLCFDTCFIHINVKADFYVFKPAVGKQLTGFVNKKSQDHVGCLTHSMFNISIPRPKDIEDEEADVDWLGTQVEIGYEVEFLITEVRLDSRLPYIRAELISIVAENQIYEDEVYEEVEEVYEEVEEIEEPKFNKKIKFSDEVEVEETQITIEEPKKHKKHKCKVELEDSGEIPEEVVQEEPKKSKKRKHIKEEIHEDVLVEPKKSNRRDQLDEVEVVNGAVAEVEQKKSNKRAHLHEAEVVNEQVAEVEPKKSNKRAHLDKAEVVNEEVADAEPKKSNKRAHLDKAEVVNEEVAEVEPKKSKKRSRVEEEEEEAEVVNDEIQAAQMERRQSPKKKKRKTNGVSNSHDRILENILTDKHNHTQEKSKKKKNSKRNSDSFYDLDLNKILNDDMLSKNLKSMNMVDSSDKRKRRKSLSTSHDISWADKEIKLPPDSDLENILNSVDEKITKIKRKHKK